MPFCLPRDPNLLFVLPQSAYAFFREELKQLNIYSPPSKYLGQAHTITRIVHEQSSVFHQIELAPCDVDQIMTRQKQRSFVKKAHPQYLMSLVQRFLGRQRGEAPGRGGGNWSTIADRFETLLDEFKDVLWFFRDEVDKSDYPDYLEFVEYEMNSATIIERMRNGFYVAHKSVKKDLARIVGNALKYNTKDSPIVDYSRFLQSVCEEALKGDLSETQHDEFRKRFHELCQAGAKSSALVHTAPADIPRDPQTKIVLKKNNEMMSIHPNPPKSSRDSSQLINKRNSEVGMSFRRAPSTRLKRISRRHVESESDEDIYSPGRLAKQLGRSRRRQKGKRGQSRERELINVEEPKRDHDGEAILKQIFENKQPHGESRIRTRRRVAFESRLKSN